MKTSHISKKLVGVLGSTVAIGIGFQPLAFGLVKGVDLPEEVCVSHVRQGENPEEPFFGAPSYIDTTVTEGGVLNGTYDAWCVDFDATLGSGPFRAEVYVTTDLSPEDLLELAGPIEMLENLDLLNWILNQEFPGKVSPGGHGVYTYGDVQRAIWALLDDDNAQNSFLGPWDINRQNEIMVAAVNNGAGYVPGCGETVGILLRPFELCSDPSVPLERQLVVIGIPCECDCELEVEAYCEKVKDWCKPTYDFSCKTDYSRDRYSSKTGGSYSYTSKYSSYTSKESCFIPILKCFFGGFSCFDFADCEKDCTVKSGSKVRFIYRVTNAGDEELANVTVTDNFGPVPGSPIAALGPGSSVVLTREVTVTEDIDPNLVLAASESEACVAEDETSVKVYVPEPPKCDWSFSKYFGHRESSYGDKDDRETKSYSSKYSRYSRRR